MIVETSPPTAPTLLDQSLLAVAQESADIRRNHDVILTKAATLRTLQEDLVEAFDRAYQALEHLAEARSQLAKAETVAKFESDAREVTARRLAAMTASYHQATSDVEKLRPEVERLGALLAQAEEKITQGESEIAQLTERLDAARVADERRNSVEATMQRELESLRGELASTNKYIAQKVSEASLLRERCEVSEQTARAAEKAVEEARGEAAGALIRLDEERVNTASAQSRIAAQETQLKDLGEKFSTARAVWSQEAERFNETVGRLKDELGKANGRNEAHQRLLAAAQTELTTMRERIGLMEAQLSESRLAASEALARAESAEQARDEVAKNFALSKRLQQSMLRRVQPMIGALREKNGENTRLNATLADFERRFAAYQKETGDTIRVQQEKVSALVADLETERARRVVAEGALAIDRSFRPIETNRRKAEAAD
jgi:chromosome segregation ATPase